MKKIAVFLCVLLTLLLLASCAPVQEVAPALCPVDVKKRFLVGKDMLIA